MAVNIGSLNVIKKLDESVINRISAGEVIHKPINVIKELIENSLDAKSTSIQVSVRDGGLKLIQIQDNGIGIRKDDLNIVCERFTTSKLEKFEDLQNMKTYGFRGEALSSISLVSRVTITTKVEHDICGYKLSFIDGKPNSNLQPLAANRGTSIVIEDLFYNQQWRRDAIKSYSDEYNRIHELVTKYAINNSNSVSFSLKKCGELNNDLNTYVGSHIIDNIKLIYGPAITKDLISLTLTDERILKFSLSGFVSNTDVSLKKINFILFVNNRLVNCSVLKKAIDELYCNHLMKGFHPFIYLSLQIELKNIDVNVHPTKSEVHFLHEEEICKNIIDMIENKISDGQQRSLPTNKLTPNTTLLEKFKSDLNSNTNNKTPSNNNSSENRKPVSKGTNLGKKINTTPKPYKHIRTDGRDRKLDEFLNRNSPSNKTTRREIRLTSVLELRKNVKEKCDTNIQNMICKSTYIGVANETFIACQHDTHLVMINIVNLNRELFYQLFLIEFANFGAIKLSNALPIKDLAKLYVNSLNEVENENKEMKIVEIEELLMNKREMLNEYFSIRIDERAQLLALPMLLEGYVPNLGYLPQFVYCLANDVQWNTEEECFHTVGQVLSQFYSKSPAKFTTDDDHNKWAKTVELSLYPAYKGILCPSKDMANNLTFHVAANLPDLYKVFERC